MYQRGDGGCVGVLSSNARAYASRIRIFPGPCDDEDDLVLLLDPAVKVTSTERKGGAQCIVEGLLSLTEAVADAAAVLLFLAIEDIDAKWKQK